MAQKSLTYKEYSYNISYEILNPSAQKDIIFLHGWGSNKELMKQSFSHELADFRHIYIDLPGFGNSSCDAVLTSYDYAAILKILFKKLSLQNFAVLGHSFGGKVATLLQPKHLILVGSSGILVPKSLKVRVKIALFKLFKFIGLQNLRRFFVADDAKTLKENMYETFKIVIAEDFSSEFRAYEGNALLFWGRSDTATPLYTAKEIASSMKNAKLFEYEGDHYFFMHHAKDISKKIEENI